MKDIYYIGELVKALKINKETIRYYEKIGLLSQPKKDCNGYRVYSKEDKEKIEMIIIFKNFGFSLKEISIIFSKIYNDILGQDVDSIKNIVEYKIKEVDDKIHELEKTKKLLQKVSNDVLSGNKVCCYDLDDLYKNKD
jgi:MerR family Zn(II)-responsive transcriptional regulator of zntA